MNNQDTKKLVQENVALKRTLEQKEQKITSLKGKVDDLNKTKKALTNQLERSKTKNGELKSALAEEQKKKF